MMDRMIILLLASGLEKWGNVKLWMIKIDAHKAHGRMKTLFKFWRF